MQALARPSLEIVLNHVIEELDEVTDEQDRQDGEGDDEIVQRIELGEFVAQRRRAEGDEENVEENDHDGKIANDMCLDIFLGIHPSELVVAILLTQIEEEEDGNARIDKRSDVKTRIKIRLMSVRETFSIMSPAGSK